MASKFLDGIRAFLHKAAEGIRQFAHRVADRLKQAYFKIEDKYYDLMDWLESKGIPVYKYFVEPIEKRGIPSFPVAVFLALAATLLFAFFAVPAIANYLAPPEMVSLQVVVVSDAGPVGGAAVELRVENDKARTLSTQADGTAVFQTLPKGRFATLSVSKEGFERAARQLKIGDDSSLTISLKVAAVSAFNRPPPSIAINYLDVNTRNPIEGVKVVYRTQEKGVVETMTLSDGSLKVSFGDEQITLYATHPDYQPDRTTIRKGDAGRNIYLTPLSTINANDSGGGGEGGNCNDAACAPKSASVSVGVTDGSGSPVEARVELYTVGSTSGPKVATTSLGSAFFGSAAQVGEQVYAIAYPVDAVKFSVGQSDKLALADGVNDISVKVKAKTPDFVRTHITLAVTVKDDAGTAVPGAKVLLYASTDTDPSAAATTGDDGTTGFEVAVDQPFTLTAFKDGFLPSDRVQLQAGALMAVITLHSPFVGNNAKVRVTTYMPDGVTPAGGASVELRYGADNFPLGIPSIDANEIGQAVFDLVPVGRNLKAVARLGVLAGESDQFSPIAGRLNEISFHLNKATGTFVAVVLDPLTGKPIAGATVTVTSPSGQAWTCTTDAKGVCTIAGVDANVPLSVKISAPGFVDKVIDGLTVLPGQTFTLNVKDDLIPSALANDSRLTVSLYDANCANRVQGDVEKGRTYCARLDYNIPANETSPVGIVVRVNGDGNASEDAARITRFQDINDLHLTTANLDVKRADQYSGASGYKCDAANAAAPNTPSKWVNYEFSNVRGNKIILLRVFVDPLNARDGDAFDFNYFSYAVRLGKYYRAPSDDALGFAKSNAQKDWCQANAKTTHYRIAAGPSAFTADAALSMSFSQTSDGARAGSLSTTVSNSTFTHFTIRTFFKPLNPSIHILAGDTRGNARDYLRFTQFAYENAAGGASQQPQILASANEQRVALDPGQFTQDGDSWVASGAFTQTATLPMPLGRIFIDVGDGAKGDLPIVRTNATVKVAGNATIVLAANPLSIPGNANSNLAVIAKRTDGTPITDTIISIDNIDGTDSPFGPYYSDRDILVAGDGTKDKGKDGKYVFKNLHPLRAGQFSIDAGGDADPRYAAASVAISVTQNNFLTANPASLSIGCSPSALNLQNTLDYAGITAKVTAPNGCVALDPAACSARSSGVCVEYSITLNAGEQKALSATGVRSGSCTLTASGLLSALAVSSTAIDTTVSCTAVKPSCTASTSDSYAVGGDPEKGKTTVTSVITNPPLAQSIIATFDCTDGTSQVAIPAGNQDSIASQSDCRFNAVPSLTDKAITVTYRDANSNAITSCATSITVLPPGAAPACKLSYRPVAGSPVAHLTAKFFNLPTSTAAAFFQCTPEDELHQTPITSGASGATAAYDCDYSSVDGSKFTATALADKAVCTNSTVTITPGAQCTLGAEKADFGKCAQAAPWLRCGGDRTNPSLATDAACCSEALGSNYAFTGDPTPHCALASGTAVSKCSDGTGVNSCSANKPWYCDDRGVLTVKPETCQCPAGYSAQAGKCVPTTPRTACDDNTPLNACSQTLDKPAYCDSSGAWIPKASICQCPAGYRVEGELCAPVVPPSSSTCQDGSSPNSCSVGKRPLYCPAEGGSLQSNAGQCGCPAGYKPDANAQKCIPISSSTTTCPDGTHAGECTATQPLACGPNIEAYVDSATKCGCPQGYLKDGESCRPAPSGSACRDGTSVGACSGTPGAPVPLRCADDRTLSTDASCCPASLGFTYDASHNACIKPSSSSSCTVTDGTTTVVTDFGKCSTVYTGLRCGGNSASPTLSPDNACCPAGKAYSDVAKACVSGTPPTSCSAFVDSSRSPCLRPNDAAVPSPFQCNNGQTEPNPFCCTNFVRPADGAVFQSSTDGQQCVAVPSAQVEPACAFTLNSVTNTATGTDALLSLHFGRLNKFAGGSATVQYANDLGNTKPTLKKFPVANEKSVIDLTSVAFHYDRQLLNYGVTPYASAQLTTGTGETHTVNCDLAESSLAPSGVINIPGSSGESVDFTGSATAAGQNWPLSPAPLGPLDRVTLTVRSLHLPTGVTPDKVTLQLACDPVMRTQLFQMTPDPVSAGTWSGDCAFASPATLNFPRPHTPVAYYRAEVATPQGTQFVPATPLGINFKFPAIAEFAKPIATGLALDQTLQSPTPQDQALKVSLKATFSGLPPLEKIADQKAYIDCGDGSGRTAIPLASIASDGTASVSRTCSYLTSPLAPKDFTASADYPYSSLSGGDVNNAGTVATLPIAYTPSAANPVCKFLGIPQNGENFIVVSDPGRNHFIPEVQISGALSDKAKVVFDCGNGKNIPATVAKSGAVGSSPTLTATASNPCSYDYSVLSDSAGSTNSKTVGLGVTVDGIECAYDGVHGIVVASSSSVAGLQFTNTKVAQAVAQVAPDAKTGLGAVAGKNAIVSFGLRASASEADLGGVYAARFDCGDGSTNPGQLTTVPLDAADQSNSVFASAASLRCEYPPVYYPQSETLPPRNQRVITATLEVKRGNVVQKIGPVTFDFWQEGTPAPVTPGAKFDSCNAGFLLPFVMQQAFPQSSPDLAWGSVQNAAKLSAQASALAKKGRKVILDPSGVLRATSADITRRKLYYSPLLGSTATDAIPVANALQKRVRFEVSLSDSCVKASVVGRTSVGSNLYFDLEPAEQRALSFTFDGSQPQCAAIANSVAPGGSGSKTITATINALTLTGANTVGVKLQVVRLGTLKEFEVITSPKDGTSIPARLASPAEPFVVANNLEKDCQTGSITLNSREATWLLSTNGADIACGKDEYSSALTPKPAVSVAGLDQYDVIGNLYAGGSGDGFECSREDFCKPDALAAASGELGSKLTAVYAPLKSASNVEEIPSPIFNQALAEQAFNSMQQGFNSFNGFGGFGGFGFQSQFALQGLSGLGFGAGGTNAAACTAMMTCFGMMQGALKQAQQECASSGKEGTLQLFQAVSLCSDPKLQESLSKGDQDAFVKLFLASQLLTQLNKCRGPKTISAGANAAIDPPSVKIPVRVADASAPFRTLECAPDGEFKVACAQSGSASGASGSGFPFVKIEGGKATTGYDGGKPNLYTLNKYDLPQTAKCEFRWADGIGPTNRNLNPVGSCISTSDRTIDDKCAAGDGCIEMKVVDGKAIIRIIDGSAGQNNANNLKDGTALSAIANDLESFFAKEDYEAPILSKVISAGCKVTDSTATRVLIDCDKGHLVGPSNPRVEISLPQSWRLNDKATLTLTKQDYADDLTVTVAVPEGANLYDMQGAKISSGQLTIKDKPLNLYVVAAKSFTGTLTVAATFSTGQKAFSKQFTVTGEATDFGFDVQRIELADGQSKTVKLRIPDNINFLGTSLTSDDTAVKASPNTISQVTALGSSTDITIAAPAAISQAKEVTVTATSNAGTAKATLTAALTKKDSPTAVVVSAKPLEFWVKSAGIVSRLPQEIRLYQIFTPKSDAILTGVKLKVAEHAPVKVTGPDLTVRVCSVSSISGNQLNLEDSGNCATSRVPIANIPPRADAQNNWVRFPATPFPLTAVKQLKGGQKYAVELSATDGLFFWYGDNSNDDSSPDGLYKWQSDKLWNAVIDNSPKRVSLQLVTR